ncbi:MAG: polyprenol monophosphomannose synthase [Ignavibacteriaceae bacterium]|jgi:dolichol-phosphate mannosyltransferase|nr:polyprenol monophosphomannose synthase [Ignavibacteriaceae bacterium]MCW8812905.1 polyprenol monophosphomannose synthase [Chlorobium sp.]MCW8823576.1 polyprenol monophosphomannose synthase [Ignavibacteriaceae bacterium]MCW8960613.1 polyprenol monophosphomannose synthase [Ignavibacteriaceae bacterium]MCW9095525.1 polyprenol monophosphomannose synthase [Ignavibacteriaceae bacterium]
MKILIIIPTYNELENLPRLLPEVFSKDINIDVLIIDDNSPDGTAAFIENEQKNNNRIHLIKRQSKQGLGTAYIAGFRFALQRDYQVIFEMDADFSHDPNEIPRFLEEIKNAEVVLGSRYKNGVNVINWPMRRLLLSWFANIYTRVITGMPLHDATGGFKCFKREVLEAIDLNKVKSNGYAFQIEMNFKSWKKGFIIKEIPIIFVDRVKGSSKMSKKIVREAVFMVWKLRFQSIFGLLK